MLYNLTMVVYALGSSFVKLIGENPETVGAVDVFLN